MMTTRHKALTISLSVALLMGGLSACSSSVSAEDFCKANKELEARIAKLDTSDSDKYQEEMLKELRGIKAPDEIKDEMTTLVKATEKLVKIDVESDNYLDEVEKIQNADYEAASEKVNTYTSDNCGK